MVIKNGVVKGDIMNEDMFAKKLVEEYKKHIEIIRKKSRMR